MPGVGSQEKALRVRECAQAYALIVKTFTKSRDVSAGKPLWFGLHSGYFAARMHPESPSGALVSRRLLGREMGNGERDVVDEVRPLDDKHT